MELSYCSSAGMGARVTGTLCSTYCPSYNDCTVRFTVSPTS